MEGGLAEEGAGDGGRGLFVLYVFGDREGFREGFREGCRRVIMRDRGYGSGGHDDGNGGEGDEGKEEKERERGGDGWDYDALPEKVVGMIVCKLLNNWTMCQGV